MTDTLWILLLLFTLIFEAFKGDLLKAYMNRRYDYKEENLFQCSFGHLTAVLRHI